MSLGHCQSSLYCYENATGLFCPPVKLSQCSGSQRLSLTSDGSAEIHAPIAEQVPYSHTYHGQKYLDEYHWLRDDYRENTEVLDHIKAENEYSKDLLAPLANLEGEIYDEIIERLTDDDETYHVTKGDYVYYQKTVKGSQYPIHCRKLVAEGSLANEEVLMDLNQHNETQLDLNAFEVSPDQKLLAYTLDTTGSETYSLFIKDLQKGTNYTVADDVYVKPFWSNDSQHLYYTTTVNAGTRGYYCLFLHRVGSPQFSEKLIYLERDPRFYFEIWKSMSQKYLFLVTQNTTSSEVRYLTLDSPTSRFKIFSAREEGRIYRLEHQADSFIVLTNKYKGKKYINNILLRSPIQQESKENDWTKVVPYDEKHYIINFLPLEKYLVLEEHFGGYTQLRVIETKLETPHNDSGYLVEFPEPIFTVSGRPSYMQYNSTKLLFEYTSFTTPKSLFSYELTTKARTLLKTESIKGGFNSSKYVAERVVAPNNVPISLVYRNNLFMKNGSNPLHLYGYGSYGLSFNPKFSSSIISLLDRGFVYAIAHVRGGSAMGQQWYETEGRLLTKRNTFRDFSNAARYLVAENYTSSERLSVEGASAGGLLVGAAINLNPGLFNAAILGGIYLFL
ncbi:hypothetical protein DSO57_1000828 [Entomophthora muscae]|uniref:Uncharacterized protein n=1 Tax=Entomophthora muscae TaxID=34485 RepID=A0ACC2U7P3_9FUNG|nr:hypothetical protein DSO57_1000828 [Entomophthora muscae]